MTYEKGLNCLYFNHRYCYTWFYGHKHVRVGSIDPSSVFPLVCVDFLWVFLLCRCPLAGLCLRTAAVRPPGLTSWLSLTNTRSWPTTAACCRSITTRATSKVTCLHQHTLWRRLTRGELSSAKNCLLSFPNHVTLTLLESIMSLRKIMCYHTGKLYGQHQRPSRMPQDFTVELCVDSLILGDEFTVQSPWE